MTKFRFTIQREDRSILLLWGNGEHLDDSWRDGYAREKAGNSVDWDPAAAELKMFSFVVENEETHERAKFLGQGKTIAEAWKEAFANLNAPFRPSSSGGLRANKPVKLAVTLPGGEIVHRAREDFENHSHLSLTEKPK